MTYKSYLVFSIVDRHATYPNRSVKREKQILNKRIDHCFLIFSDGLIVDYNRAGLFTGYQDFPNGYPFWIPGILADDELRYVVLKSKDFSVDERNELLSKLDAFRSYTGETELDIVYQTQGFEVPELKSLKRLTHSSLIAYLYGLEDYWLWDAERVYHELGEQPLPGTITDYVLEK